MRILKISLLAAMIMAGVAAPAAARGYTLCATATIAITGGSCPAFCQSLRDPRSGWQQGLYKPIPPATTLPPSIASCTTKSVADSANACQGCTDCVITVCGPAPSRTFQASKPARSPCAQPGDPCHQRSSTVVGPGLLEGDTGFANQGPAAAGTASTGRAPTGSAPTGIPGRR